MAAVVGMGVAKTSLPADGISVACFVLLCGGGGFRVDSMLRRDFLTNISLGSWLEELHIFTPKN